jgi:hypothetical protein
MPGLWDARGSGEEQLQRCFIMADSEEWNCVATMMYNRFPAFVRFPRTFPEE